MIITYIMAWCKARNFHLDEVEDILIMLHEKWDVFYEWEAKNDPNHYSEWMFFPGENRWYKVFAHTDPMPDEIRWGKVNVSSQEEYDELERIANEDYEWEQQQALHDESMAHDNPSYVGNMPMSDIVIERAQTIGWELYGWWEEQTNLWRWFIANDPDMWVRAQVSSVIHRYSLSNSATVEELEMHQFLSEKFNNKEKK